MAGEGTEGRFSKFLCARRIAGTRLYLTLSATDLDRELLRYFDPDDYLNGARLSSFSAPAGNKHQNLLGKQALTLIGKYTGLKVMHFRGFLLGVNQLNVLIPTGEHL